MSWGQDEGDKGCREEHLDDGDVAIIAAEDLGEGIGVIDAETLGGAFSVRAALVLVSGGA